MLKQHMQVLVFVPQFLLIPSAKKKKNRFILELLFGVQTLSFLFFFFSSIFLLVSKLLFLLFLGSFYQRFFFFFSLFLLF